MAKNRFHQRKSFSFYLFTMIIFIFFSCKWALNMFNFFFNVEPIQSITSKANETEMVVYSFNELKEALNSDTITSVYLGKDITMDGGIIINPVKEYLIIDGINPYDAEKIIHTLTEFDSPAMAQTIVLNSNVNLNSITLRNIVIHGSNFYGTICIEDSAKNISIIYDNLEYYGPQLAYNRYGTVIFKDILIKLGKYNRSSPAEEAGEVGNVILRGNVNITQVESQAYEIFRFPLQSGSIEIDSDAVVNISTYNYSGFVYSIYDVDFVARYGSQFYYNAPSCFYEALGAMNDFTVEDHAIVHINITNTKDKAVLLVNGSLYVGEGAELHLISNKGLFSVLRIKKMAVFNNPNSVLLYSPAFRPIVYISQGELDIQSQQLNYWTTAGQGDSNDIPLYSWRKANQTIFKLKGKVAAEILGELSLTSTNYGSEDSAVPVLPDNNHFNLTNARVIALGRLEINGEYEFLSENSSRIIGNTKPDTEVLLSYTDKNEELVYLHTTADKNGKFSFVFDDIFLNDTVVYLKGFNQYLQCETTILVKEKSLQFEFIPDIMFFPNSKIKPYPEIIKRKEKDWKIIVYNSLGAGTKWKLTANLMTNETNKHQFPLAEGALIFINEYGQTKELSIDKEVVIMEHTAVNDVEFVTVRWDDDKGVLLNIQPGTVLKDIIYTATIKWSLINAP